MEGGGGMKWTREALGALAEDLDEVEWKTLCEVLDNPPSVDKQMQELSAQINSLKKRINDREIIDPEVVQELAEVFKSFDKLKALRERKAKPAVPKIPKAPDPPELAANCIHNHVVGRAVAAGGRKTRQKVGGWYENSVDGRPVYRYEHKGSVVTVYLEPQDYNAMELWAKVHGLDALTLDVYLATLALICDPKNKAAYPHFGWFVVNPAQVADMKAFRRYGNDRRVLIGKIVEALHTLSDLRTTFTIPWPGQ